MFRMSSFREYVGEIITIKIKKKYKNDNQLELFPEQKRPINNPLEWPFGVYIDIDGKKWDCQGRYGEHVLTRPYVIDYFNDTSMQQYDGIQTATYIPCKVEMVD